MYIYTSYIYIYIYRIYIYTKTKKIHRHIDTIISGDSSDAQQWGSQAYRARAQVSLQRGRWTTKSRKSCAAWDTNG